MNLLLSIIALLYAGTGIVATVGYFPTIRDLLNKKKSANINSYIIWTLCALVTVLYSWLVVHDLLLILVTGANFLCCALILVLVLKLEHKK